MELGASIFVRVNKIMWRATDEFNLSRFGFEDEDVDTAIWDGEQILFTVRFLAVYYLFVLASFSFQDTANGLLGLLGFLDKQPQVSVEVWLSLTKKSE